MKLSEPQQVELERIRSWACCLEPERRFNAEIEVARLKAENSTLKAWQRAARKQHPELEKLIAAIAPKGEGEVIEIINPPRMWNPNE